MERSSIIQKSSSFFLYNYNGQFISNYTFYLNYTTIPLIPMLLILYFYLLFLWILNYKVNLELFCNVYVNLILFKVNKKVQCFLMFTIDLLLLLIVNSYILFYIFFLLH